MRALVIALVVVFAFGVQSQPQKPVWPTEFDAAFGLYYPGLGNGIPPVVNITSHFYYSWSIKSTLIDYPAGCIPISAGAQKLPCKFVFNSQGCYFSSPAVPQCLMFPGVGSVPPAFLEAFNFSTATVATDLYGVAHFVNFWVAADGFQYWTDVSQFNDIEFLDGGSILWTWGPLLTRTQDPSNFQVAPNAPACPTSLFSEVLSHKKRSELLQYVPYASFSKFVNEKMNQ